MDAPSDDEKDACDDNGEDDDDEPGDVERGELYAKLHNGYQLFQAYK